MLQTAFAKQHPRNSSAMPRLHVPGNALPDVALWSVMTACGAGAKRDAPLCAHEGLRRRSAGLGEHRAHQRPAIRNHVR